MVCPNRCYQKKVRLQKLHRWKANRGEKVPDTEHSKRYEVVGVPQILHIKVKHNEDGRKEDINFSKFINMRGTRFRLQTAMIYDGSALQGHWRSLIKENIGFGLYSDANQPKHLTDKSRNHYPLGRRF